MGSSRTAIGATVLPALQPAVPVAFRSLTHAGLPGLSVLILALRSLTLEMLAPLHGSAQMEHLSPAVTIAAGIIFQTLYIAVRSMVCCVSGILAPDACWVA